MQRTEPHLVVGHGVCLDFFLVQRSKNSFSQIETQILDIFKK